MQRPWGRGRARAGNKLKEREAGRERVKGRGSRRTFGAHALSSPKLPCSGALPSSQLLRPSDSFSCRSHWKSPFLLALLPFNVLFLASPLHLCVPSPLFPLCNFIIILIFYHNCLCPSSVPRSQRVASLVIQDSDWGWQSPVGKGFSVGHLRTWLWTDSRAGSRGAVPSHPLQAPSPPTASGGHLPLPHPSPPPVKHQGCPIPQLNPHNHNLFHSLKTHSLST